MLPVINVVILDLRPMPAASESDLLRKISDLESETNALQLQLITVTADSAKKELEIELISEGLESKAWLQSQIDSNLVEIEQLKAEVAELREIQVADREMNKLLEDDLDAEIKRGHRKDAELTKFDSVKAELEIVLDEVDEQKALRIEIDRLKTELAALQSEFDLLKVEYEKKSTFRD